MRRLLFVTIGILEFVVAGLLVNLNRQLPAPDEIDRSFGNAHQVTTQAGNQVRLLRRQVHDLRRPEIQQLAERLQTQTRTVTATLRSQQVDYETVRTMHDVVGEVGTGLDAVASTLDPGAINQLADGLGTTADFLDNQVVPAATQAADHLDQSTADLQADAQRLSLLLREAPLDLKAAREVHDSLGHFGEGLDRMNTALDLKRLETMREGFDGLETSLTTGAEQVERLSGYSYPMVEFSGFKPSVEQKPFWPEGQKIAEGMRKAAAGASEAGKQMDDMVADLPHIRTSLEESRKVVDRTRAALGEALEKEDRLEPLLRDIPTHTARLAEELPRLGGDLSHMMRQTSRLREVAAALRQTQQGITRAVVRWPELRKTLAGSAVFLQTMQQQLNDVLQHRQQYEAALNQIVTLGEAFAVLLPLLTDQIMGQLREEEQGLDDLGKSIDEMGTAIPAYGEATSSAVRTGRLLIWLVVAIVALHGAFLVFSGAFGRVASGEGRVASPKQSDVLPFSREPRASA